jgi:DNA-binding winged helix-turn-helix (wHTH) protein/Tfp pilus assembly protein PilF
MTMKSIPESNSPMRFGVFEADLRSGELRKNGIRIKIQDLPFRALKLFLAHPNKVLSRDEFRQELWPEDVFVDFDHGISSAINRLRDALGDSAENPVFIETVERRGYRWIAPTHTALSAYIPMPVTQGMKRLSAPIPPQPWSGLANPKGQPPVIRARLVNSERIAWMLVFPVIALVLAAWSFQPFFRAAKAAPRKATVPAPAPLVNASQRGSSSEAEQFYLKGRFYWQKRTADGLNRAVDAFTQAIVRDANYAPAYVGLADCYNLLREYTLMPANEAYPRALAAASRAVALDDHSSEAHASLAFALFYGMWDTANAEREFRRAIELNPQNAVAHHWYATFLATVSRHDESLVEIERAQALDPSSKAILADKGDLLWIAGRREEATALLKQLESTEPDFVSPHRYLKGIYFATGDYANFLAEWKKEALLMRDTSALKLIDAAEKGYQTGGGRGMLQNELAQQRRLYERGLTSPYALAETNALLGNKQEAFHYLEIAYEKHDDSTVQLENDPSFDNLHRDPAYKNLVARLGIPAQN